MKTEPKGNLSARVNPKLHWLLKMLAASSDQMPGLLRRMTLHYLDLSTPEIDKQRATDAQLARLLLKGSKAPFEWGIAERN